MQSTNPANTWPYTGNFFYKQEKEAIRSYVQENINPIYSENYEEFVPLVMKEIEFICTEWLSEVKHVASCNRFNTKLTHRIGLIERQDYTLDIKAVSCVIRIFLDKFKIKNRRSECGKDEKQVNTLCPDIFPNNASTFSLDCYWTPKNPYIYPDAVKAKRYTFDLEKNDKISLKNALSKVPSDIAFKSCEGHIIPAHLFVLQLEGNSYFQGMLKNDYKETKEKIISIPLSSTLCVTNLVQFIYEGQIDSALYQNLNVLLELVQIAHQTGIKDLFNHCLDLIEDYIQQKEGWDPEMIFQVLNMNCFYEIEDFLLPCLELAEKVETENSLKKTSQKEEISDSSNESVDWQKLPVQHCLKLLALAARNSLHKVENQLIAVLKNQIVINL